MTATQIAYTASYTTTDGQTITGDRTSHRTYTHAAVVQFSDDKIVIASFHSSEALAIKGNLTAGQKENGVKVIAAVPVTVKSDVPAETPAVATPETAPEPTLSDRVDAAYAAADAKKTTRKPVKKTAKSAPKADAELTPSNADIETAAAELAAEPMATNGHAVVEFFRHLEQIGQMNTNTARNYVGLFRSVITDGHARGMNADVTKVNMDNVWDRYRAAKPTITDKTASVYRQFALRAVKMFLAYRENPTGWTPTGHSEARRPRVAHHDFPLADGTTLRVTHTPGADLKAALESALASLDTVPSA